MDAIYLDHAASTPIHPNVLEQMLPYLSQVYGNPSSIHSFGRKLQSAINEARDACADALQCPPQTLIFTSGGTESNNTVLYGVSSKYRFRDCHIITAESEHHSVLHACRKMERLGVSVTYVPVDKNGRVDTNDVYDAIRPQTRLISVMYGNNETGTLQPIEEIGRIAKEQNILFHVDGVQALGMVSLNLTQLPLDFMSFSAHKINGPKGTGLLYAADNTSIDFLMSGGSQERERRAGTENAAGIVGFSAAPQIAESEREQTVRRYSSLRQSMVNHLANELGSREMTVNGHPSLHLPHILNVSFPGANTESLLMNLDLEGIAASSGSACTSGSLKESHVLRAMHLPEEVVDSAVRFSVGLGNTEEDIRQAALKTASMVRRLKKK